MSNKDKLQEECVKAIYSQLSKTKTATILAAPGFGKTKIAFTVIEAFNKSGFEDIVYVVPSLPLEQQVNALKGNLKFECHFIDKYVKNPKTCKLLILDECHRYVSDIRINVFKTNYEYLLCMTGTLPLEDKYEFIRQKSPICYELSIEGAIDNKVTEDFIELNVLIDTDLKEYNKIEQGFYTNFGFFGEDLTLVSNCLKSKSHRLNVSRMFGITEQDVLIKAKNVMNYMAKRKKFCYEHPDKIKAVETLVELLKNRKIITFSLSNKAASSIKKGLPYHSGIKPDKLEKTLNDFVSGNINCINTTKKLDEGFDCPDIDTVIIIAGFSKQIQHQQRLSRATRLKANKNQVYVINLLINNTVDVRWCIKRQIKSKVKTIKLNQLYQELQ